MNLLANTRIRINKDVVTRVKRNGSGNGTITVMVGQEVSPADSLGKFIIKSGFRKLNLANLLSLPPLEVKATLQRQVGQPIFRGELLAFKKAGFLSGEKVVTSPSDGTLDYFNEQTGEARLQLSPKEVSLPAGLFGIVEKVDQIRGEVIIKTEATEIFGIGGSGRIREGLLKVLGEPGLLVDKGVIGPDLSGNIVVAGGLVYGDAIFQAMEMGVVGIVTGGVMVSDYKSMAGGTLKPHSSTVDIGLSLVVTEGFGAIPIGPDIYEVLTAYRDKFVFIDGNSSKIVLPSVDGHSMINIRRVGLAKSQDDEKELEARQLEIGQTVRVIGTQFLGQQGRVVSIEDKPKELPSQIKTYLVTVATKSGKFKIPYSNLEIIG